MYIFIGGVNFWKIKNENQHKYFKIVWNSDISDFE